MLKRALFLLIFFTISCSTNSNISHTRPKLQETDNIIVRAAGFTYEYKMNKLIDMEYYINIRFPDILKVADKYIIIEFQDPTGNKKEQYFSRIFLIRPDNKSLYIKSKKFYGFKNMEIYPIIVKLSEDKNGTEIIESFTQYVRVEFIPQGYKNEM